MKILDRHICWELLVTFVLTIIVSTLVGVLGVVPKAVTAEGAGLHMVGMVMLYSMPKILCYTLPIGLLVSVVLVFNRMSADNEISAMRASGITLLQIITPVVLSAIAISATGWYLWFSVSPNASLEAKLLMKEVAFNDPVKLIAGNTSSEVLQGFYLMHGGQIGKDRLKDVTIYMQDRKTGKLLESISAKEAQIRVNKQAQSITLILHDFKTTRFDHSNPERAPQYPQAKVFEQEISYARHSNKKPLVRREKEMTIKQLFAWIKFLRADGRDHWKHSIQLHWRAAWALSPFTFILIGIPLGLQIARRENYAGIVGCLGVMAVFYIPMVLLGDTLPRRWSPQLCIVLMWVINLSLQALGLTLLVRKR
jgi:lipopolysaccharide export system permease protein